MRYFIIALIFITNAFLVVSSDIQTFYITCNTADFNYIYENFDEDHYIPIELENDGETWTNVEMRIRGDDSRKFPKKSLKIKFNDEPFKNGRDKINFNAEYTDPTYMRQFLASYIYNKIGHPCFKAEHARIYLNGEYFGIYLMVENIDSDFLLSNDIDPIGNLYKATHDGACLSIFDDIYVAWEKKTNEHQSRDDLQVLIDSLEYVPESDYYDFCKRTFDYDKMLNIIAMNIMLSNGSTYYHNYYMYHDIHGTGKWTMLPWDMDKTFIAYSSSFPYDFSGWEWIHDNPFLERALVNEQIFSDILNRIDQFRQSIFNNETLHPIIDSLANTLESSVEEDKTINIETMDTYWEHIELNKQFIDDRYNFLMYQMKQFPKNFRVNRIQDIQSDDVLFSWSHSQSKLGNEISYSLYVSSSRGYAPDRTKVFDNIKDTFFVADDLDFKGICYYKVEAKDDNKVTIGWDDQNSFLYQKGTQMPCEITSDLVLSKEDSPVTINCYVTIHEDTKLLIEKGTELICSHGAKIMVNGSLAFLGSSEEPVKIHNSISNNSLFEIMIDNATDQCIIDHLEATNIILSVDSSKLDISNSKFTITDDISFDGPTCRLEWGEYKVENCEISSNGLTGGILIRHGNIIADSNSLFNVPDAIECDPCNDSYIINNKINISSDDGIDLNGSRNVKISGNKIFDVIDKGISIGSRFDVRSDSIEISRNIISGCLYGIALKTARHIKVYNNTLWKNQTNLSVTNPDNLPIGTIADVSNTILSQATDQSFQKDDISEITISYTLCDETLFQGTNNIKADPLFVDPGNNDFRLLPNSPCINAGDPHSPRDPDGSRVDIGAIPYLQQQGIVINEICYNPPDDRDCGDWVEFYNPTEFPIEMEQWYFNDANDDNIFYFPDNFRLLSQSFIVLSNDMQSFKQYYPDVTNVIGEFDFGFRGSGELLRLYNSGGELIDHVLYDDKEPWPTEPDGDGPTLELISSELDNALPESWQSSEDYGTPGRKNSEPGTSVDRTILSEYITMSVYPNPVEHFLHITIESRQDTQYKLYIANQLGQKIELKTNIVFMQGKNELHIDLSNLSSGVYYLIAETLMESSAIMVIKR